MILALSFVKINYMHTKVMKVGYVLCLSYEYVHILYILLLKKCSLFPQIALKKAVLKQ
jgi:hypothetical protein